MALCEMCGKASNLFLAEVEGVELKVCSACAEHGKVKFARSGAVPEFRKKALLKKEELEEGVVENFSQLIRQARERSRLSQEDFAKFLNEKESITSKWESGTLLPSLEEARCLQKLLGLTLVVREEVDERTGLEKAEKRKPGDDTLTLGDFIKVKKRK